jgi:hypothetical protein
MAPLRKTGFTSRFTSLVLPVTALQILLLPPVVQAKAARESALTQALCTPPGVRQDLGADNSPGQVGQSASTQDAKDDDGHGTSLLSAQALINLHFHETPAGITRLAACVAPAQVPFTPANSSRPRS